MKLFVGQSGPLMLEIIANIKQQDNVGWQRWVLGKFRKKAHHQSIDWESVVRYVGISESRRETI